MDTFNFLVTDIKLIVHSYFVFLHIKSTKLWKYLCVLNLALERQYGKSLVIENKYYTITFILCF